MSDNALAVTIHILRNPWGYSVEQQRAARLHAADEMERLVKVEACVDRAWWEIERAMYRMFDFGQDHNRVSAQCEVQALGIALGLPTDVGQNNE